MKTLDMIHKFIALYGQIEYIEIIHTQLSNIPKSKGLYFFKNRTTGHIDYVGTATGKKGLYQRIKTQHLRKSYNESVFRKKIEEKNEIQNSVDYITQNYLLGILIVEEHTSIIKALEQILILETSSKFNSENKNT